MPVSWCARHSAHNPEGPSSTCTKPPLKHLVAPVCGAPGLSSGTRPTPRSPGGPPLDGAESSSRSWGGEQGGGSLLESGLSVMGSRPQLEGRSKVAPGTCPGSPQGAGRLRWAGEAGKTDLPASAELSKLPSGKCRAAALPSGLKPLSADFPSCPASPFVSPCPALLPQLWLHCQPPGPSKESKPLAQGRQARSPASPALWTLDGSPEGAVQLPHLDGLQERDMPFPCVGLCHLSGPGSCPECPHS